MITIVVFLLLIHGCNSWILNATQTRVHNGIDEHVTLTCRYDLDNELRIKIKEVERIGIFKNNNNKWTPYAEVKREGNRTVVLVYAEGDGITAHGLTGQASQSYLSVTWEISSRETVGTYVCRVQGLTGERSTGYFDTTTETVKMVQWKDTLTSFFQYEERSGKLQRKSKALQLNSSVLRNESYASQRQSDALQRQSDELQRESDWKQKQSEVIHSQAISMLRAFASLRRPTTQTTNQSTQWPKGKVVLLKANTRCPKSMTSYGKWSEGYVRFHTESQRYPNNDSVSNPSHMAEPVKVREGHANLVYMHTCKHAANEKSSAPDYWPKGTYCILQAEAGVPVVGFNEGFIFLDMEDVGPWSAKQENGSRIIVNVDGDVELFFGCREDGHHSNPIELPVEIPFNLFRLGGRCQEVLNAQVTEESFTVDTEDVCDDDRKMLSHPDVDLNPVRFYTCYYQPIRSI